MPTQTSNSLIHPASQSQLEFPEFDTVVEARGDGTFVVSPMLVVRSQRISAAEAASILGCATRTVFDMVWDPELRERLGVKQRAAGCKLTLDRAAVETLAGEDWRVGG